MGNSSAMSKILLVVGAGAAVSLLAAGCQGPHPYRTVPPTSISVPAAGSGAGSAGGASTSGGTTGGSGK